MTSVSWPLISVCNTCALLSLSLSLSLLLLLLIISISPVSSVCAFCCFKMLSRINEKKLKAKFSFATLVHHHQQIVAQDLLRRPAAPSKTESSRLLVAVRWHSLKPSRRSQKPKIGRFSFFLMYLKINIFVPNTEWKKREWKCGRVMSIYSRSKADRRRVALYIFLFIFSLFFFFLYLCVWLFWLVFFFFLGRQQATWWIECTNALLLLLGLCPSDIRTLFSSSSSSLPSAAAITAAAATLKNNNGKDVAAGAGWVDGSRDRVPVRRDEPDLTQPQSSSPPSSPSPSYRPTSRALCRCPPLLGVEISTVSRTALIGIFFLSIILTHKQKKNLVHWSIR